jgi:hypothetical protein
MHLTHKQLVNKCNPCKIFFKANEGAGTTITDLASGLKVVDAGMTWAEANTSTLGIAAYDNSDNYDLLDLAGKHLLLIHCFKVNTASSFANFTISDKAATTRLYAMSGGGGFQVNDTSGAATTAVFGTPGTGVYLQAGTWNPVTGVANAYEGVDGAAPVLTGTDTANAARLAVSDVIGDFTITVNTAGFDQDTYAMALFAFDTGIPSDLLTALAAFSTGWQTSVKSLWTPWNDIT